MLPNSPAEWIIILVIVLLLFGGSQLPKLARNLGEAQKEFKKGINEGMKDDASAKDASAKPADAPAKSDESETKQ